MDTSPDYLTEEREDQMVSPVPGERRGEATLRPAHFLTPTGPSGEFPATDFPSKPSNLKVNFRGWKHPPKDWKHWTDRMSTLHNSVWKKVGIFEAILSSCCKIHRCDDLIYTFVEKWCPETNTFVFPWGEATLTLEDVMMIGGYSVVGEPVFSSLEFPEMKEVEQKLLSARSEISSSKAKMASQGPWQRKFMETGSEIEHEAFLAMWLSRFVFPRNTQQSVIHKHVLPIAILLARGIKIALAPAVLAGIYSNLSDMKNAFACDGVLEVSVYAPFQLLQVWIWERFSSLRPSRVVCRQDQTWFSRWGGLRFKAVVDVGSTIDESADCFVWRPYVIDCENSFNDGARFVSVGFDPDEGAEMLVRCVRFSELVGIDSDCIEKYFPHRVSMQFGYDQDVPGPVARVNGDQIMAWESYIRKVEDQRLYIPPRLFEADVTSRYAKWWKKNMSASSISPKKRISLECTSSKKAVNKVEREKKKAGSTGSLHKNCKPIKNCLNSKGEPSEMNLKISENTDDKVQNIPKKSMSASCNNLKKGRFLEGCSSKKAVSKVKGDKKKMGSTGTLHKKQKPFTNRLDSKEEQAGNNLEKTDDKVQNIVRLSGSGTGIGDESDYDVPDVTSTSAEEWKENMPVMNHLDSKVEPSEKSLEKHDDKVENKVRFSGSGNVIGGESDNNVPDVTSRYAEGWTENMASSSKKAVSKVKRDTKKAGSTGSQPAMNCLDSKEEPSEKNSEKNDDRVENRDRLSGSENGLGNEPDENVPSSSRNSSISKTASGNGCQRDYIIEEVEAMIAGLEKTWADVKARKS